MAAADLTTIESLVVAELNANTTYSNASTDPRFYTNQIRDAVLNADGAVCEAILVNTSNGQRVGFIASITVNHGALLPEHLGSIDAVLIGGKAAVPWDASEIENERLNRLALTSINPHYAVSESILYHNGATVATVQYGNYTRTLVCQAPDEYSHLIMCGALAELFSVEGENDSTASMYAQQFQAGLAAIRGGGASQ